MLPVWEQVLSELLIMPTQWGQPYNVTRLGCSLGAVKRAYKVFPIAE